MTYKNSFYIHFLLKANTLNTNLGAIPLTTITQIPADNAANANGNLVVTGTQILTEFNRIIMALNSLIGNFDNMSCGRCAMMN